MGTLFVRRALAQGHQLTLYARNPSKLSVETQQHDRVNIIEGELNNEESLRNAAECGATVLVSCAGPLGNNNGTVRFHRTTTSRTRTDKHAPTSP